MKKCMRCTKPATYHITELEHGDVEELHLCESCAHDYISGNEPGPVSSYAEKISDLAEVENEFKRSCTQCGITFAEFRKRGRLGCPSCYLAFQDLLMPLINHIHGATEHRGKLPRRAPTAGAGQYRLIQLRNRLRSAVEDEDYEAAAALRDQIQQLETELTQQG